MEENTINMPDTGKLVISSSPHFHSQSGVRKIMLMVILSLLPGIGAGIWYFGMPAFWVLFTCTFSCLAMEAICSRCMKRPMEINDLSAIVTGLLLGMNLPSTTPIWICVVGSFLAIVVAKMLYGGIGCNPFNPALVGRVGLLIAFPRAMSTFLSPYGFTPVVDAVVQATPLTELSVSHVAPTNIDYFDLFIGRGLGGSLGETCTLALLVGGIFLICLNIIRWQVPVCFIGTVMLTTGIAWLIAPDTYADPLFHALTGGLVLGAFFMATDMVTTPLSRTGAIVFAVGCGLITSGIRLFGSYPEGVSFSILIMNALTPMIDRFTSSKPFGTPKTRGVELK